MDFSYTPEQTAFRSRVRAFCEEHVAPRAQAWDEAADGIPNDVFAGLASIGALGCTYTDAYGGCARAGEEAIHASIVIHELARADLSMALPVYVLLQLGWGSLIARHGTESLRKEVLPSTAAGQTFLGIATTEEGGGSDIANLQTRGELAGDSITLNGSKCYVGGARETREQRDGGHLVLFRTDPNAGHRGMTLAYVPARSKGIRTEALHTMGRHALSQAKWFYDGVTIPRHYVLGEIGRGFFINMEGFNFARILVSSACAGAAERALEIARDHVKQRHAFGRPIAKFEGVSFQIAEDYARLEQIKLMIQRAAWMVDRFYAEPGSVTAKELNAAASICKLEAPQIAFEICKHTLMHQGAYGYSDASPMGMALRGIMSYLAGAEGSMNIQKLIIAREFIGNEAVPYR